jgi:TonB family protein
MKTWCTLLIGCVASLATLAEDKVIPRTPIVLACVDRDGKLVQTEIAETSGYPDLDAAALKVAQASKFTPGTSKWTGKPLKRSCIKFKVKFVLRDGEPVAEGT